MARGEGHGYHSPVPIVELGARTTAAPMPPIARQLLFLLLAPLGIALLEACSGDSPGEAGGRVTAVFKHFKLMGDPAPLDQLIAEFERVNPDVRVRQETLPTSSDEQH